MYRNGQFVIALLVTGLMALAAGVNAASGDFNVSSYIPQYFKDARLYTSASIRLYGNGNKSEADSANGIFYQSEISEYKYSSFSANLNLNHSLRYITIPLWYEISTRIGPGWSYNKNTNDQTHTGRPTQSSVLYDYHSESTNGYYNLNLYESIDFGQYLDGDWFLAGSVYLNYGYSKNYKNEGSQTTTNRNASGGAPRTITEDYSRYESEGRPAQFPRQSHSGAGYRTHL